MRFFFGVTSKNVVDTVLQYSLENPDSEVCFIPSRRQVDYNGGYCGFTTQSFSEYVKSVNPRVLIERDHGGPAQGSIIDNGYDSLKEDCKYFDIIHVDPWKYCDTFLEGVQWTIDMINFCHALNPKIQYEVATEEAIFPLTAHQISALLSQLQEALPPQIFSQIKYCVIQCGTSLCEMTNTGVFNPDRLTEMIEVCKKFNVIPKEHNGDWVPKDKLKNKLSYGLENINIAPELSCLESKVILDTIRSNKKEYELLYKICLASEKWKRWVSSDFKPDSQKDIVITTSCQYIFCDKRFIDIKNKYTSIDKKIKETLYDRILELYDIYTLRKRCVFCESVSLNDLFSTNTQTSLSISFGSKGESPYSMPFNIQICSSCNCVQTKYLGNLDIIYNKNHIDICGSLKQTMYNQFSDFITENKAIQGILEAGACFDFLSNRIKENLADLPYIVVDPAYIGKSDRIQIIPEFIENVNISALPINTVIMSHIFEHLYEPSALLKKLQSSTNIQYIYLNHPDFEHNIKTNTYVVLNSEHTFYIEHDVLIAYFKK